MVDGRDFRQVLLSHDTKVKGTIRGKDYDTKFIFQKLWKPFLKKSGTNTVKVENAQTVLHQVLRNTSSNTATTHVLAGV